MKQTFNDTPPSTSDEDIEVLTGHFYFIFPKANAVDTRTFDPQTLWDSVIWCDEQLGGIPDRNVAKRKWRFGGVSGVTISENFHCKIYTVSVRPPGIHPLPINKSEFEEYLGLMAKHLKKKHSLDGIAAVTSFIQVENVSILPTRGTPILASIRDLLVFA